MRGRRARRWKRRIGVRMDTSLIPTRRANVQSVASTTLNGCRKMKVIVRRDTDVFAAGANSTFRGAPPSADRWSKASVVAAAPEPLQQVRHLGQIPVVRAVPDCPSLVSSGLDLVPT